MKKSIFLFLVLILSFNVKANDGFTLQFCDGAKKWYSLLEQNKVDYKCYLYITPTMATAMAGNKITEIILSAASLFQTMNREGNVFVTENLDGENITSKACNIIDSQNNWSGGYCQTVSLDEPYVIKANTGFYFGYTVKSCRYSKTVGSDCPVGVDDKTPNGFSGFVTLTDAVTGAFIATIDIEKDLGTNLFLAAKTVGEVKGFDNLFTLGNMSITSDFTLPVFAAKSPVPLKIPLINIGANPLTSFEYYFSVNDLVASDVKTMNIDVAPNGTSYINIQSPTLVDGRNNIALNISKINGVATNVSSNASCFVLENDGYNRKFVIEEGTGTWCGYCPRGIVSLKKMTEKYPDSFIGIAVHKNDNLAPASYSLLQNLFEGLPNSIANRDPKFIVDPSYDKIENAYNKWMSQRSPAKIELAVAETIDGLNVTTKTTFAYDEEKADYRLAFVILEDGIEGVQRNYYAGNPGTLEWWDEQSETVKWTFEHTACDIFEYTGIANSVPSKIKAKEPLNYTMKLSTSNVKNKEQTSVIALLLDGKTGVVLNAANVSHKDYTSEIENAVAESVSAPIQYYNLQGIRISNPVKGSVVIRRQGNNVTKMIVR